MPKGENGSSCPLKISAPSNEVGVIIAKGEGSVDLCKRDGVFAPLELSEDVFEGFLIPKASVTGGKTIFASVKIGRSDEAFAFGAAFEKDLILSASGRPCSSILFFFEYFLTLHGASVLFPSASVRILFEIEAFHLFLMLLSVLPGIRCAIVDHFGPNLR